MTQVYLRCHPFGGHRQLVRLILTAEQEEAMNKWAQVSEDEFAPPDYHDGRGVSLWPFVEKKVRDKLGIGEWITCYCSRSFWKPKVPVEDLLPGAQVVEVDLSGLPLEIWHPDAPTFVNPDNLSANAELDDN